MYDLVLILSNIFIVSVQLTMCGLFLILINSMITISFVRHAIITSGLVVILITAFILIVAFLSSSPNMVTFTETDFNSHRRNSEAL